jgi:hypothetical protein
VLLKFLNAFAFLRFISTIWASVTSTKNPSLFVAASAAVAKYCFEISGP